MKIDAKYFCKAVADLCGGSSHTGLGIRGPPVGGVIADGRWRLSTTGNHVFSVHTMEAEQERTSFVKPRQDQPGVRKLMYEVQPGSRACRMPVRNVQWPQPRQFA